MRTYNLLVILIVLLSIIISAWVIFVTIPAEKAAVRTPGEIKAQVLKKLYGVELTPEEASVVSVSFVGTDVQIHADSISIWNDEWKRLKEVK
jgi:uncharacterized protein (DUF697 family)